MTTAIKIENLSKQYRTGEVSLGSMAHDFNRWWHRITGKPDPYLSVTEANDRAHAGHSEYVWALKDINLEVKEGEVLGIIGRNGAGKSTLLKILSRVTAPTTGHAKVRGRMASLLEVGTGFHPDLTGRENIFLNGAILGMTRKEVARKLDEIVEFSGCERYIDTPVKRYSSGMMVRLGFSVAAHLEPEILVVDEVLAVGDSEFRVRCLGKMKTVARSGRTVLFVSHNLDAIRMLCDRVVHIRSGKIAGSGCAPEIIAQYLHGASDALTLKSPPTGVEGVTIIGAEVQSLDGRRLACVELGQPWKIHLEFEIRENQNDFVVALGIQSISKIGIQTTWTQPADLPPGSYAVDFIQDKVKLACGSYTLIVGFSRKVRSLFQQELLQLDVVGGKPESSDYFPEPSGAGYVLNSMEVKWDTL